MHDAMYPDGAGDMAGYWAELQILGGVVLFDRRHPESHDVYFHPSKFGHTYRIYKLLDDQKLALLQFLTSDPPPTTGENGPLPILPSQDNRERVDPEEPIHLTGVFRDPWERRVLRESDGDARMITYWNHIDYPTMQDFGEAKERYETRFDRYCASDL